MGRDPDREVAPEIFPGTPERDYFGAVERRFQQLRGSPILLSPKDWLRISSWWDRGIPVETVLEGIELAFAKRQGGASGSRIRSLGYCEPIILDVWERRRQQSVAAPAAHAAGATEGWTGDRLRQHFAGLVNALRAAAEQVPDLSKATDRCIGWLERAAAGAEPTISATRIQELEDELLALERHLAAAARRVLSADQIEGVGATVDEKLRPYREMMSEETFRETREYMLEDGYRRKLALPRLSLFYVD